MSKLICSSAIEGAIAWVARAEGQLDEAVAAKGESCAVGFPDTAYFLPVIYSFTGEKMQTLADLRRILKRAKELLPARPSEKVWLPYLGNTLDAGVAALFACEVIEACKYLIGPKPVDGIWLGAQFLQGWFQARARAQRTTANAAASRERQTRSVDILHDHLTDTQNLQYLGREQSDQARSQHDDPLGLAAKAM